MKTISFAANVILGTLLCGSLVTAADRSSEPKSGVLADTPDKVANVSIQEAFAFFGERFGRRYVLDSRIKRQFRGKTVSIEIGGRPLKKVFLTMLKGFRWKLVPQADGVVHVVPDGGE